MKNDPGAVSATEAVSVDRSSADTAAPHVVTHHCGYNEQGIRIAVVMPFEDGYAIPGLYVGGGSAAYGGGLPLVKFYKAENAQRYVEMRNPCTAIRWTEETMNEVRR